MDDPLLKATIDSLCRYRVGEMKRAEIEALMRNSADPEEFRERWREAIVAMLDTYKRFPWDDATREERAFHIVNRRQLRFDLICLKATYP